MAKNLVTSSASFGPDGPDISGRVTIQSNWPLPVEIQ